MAKNQAREKVSSLCLQLLRENAKTSHVGENLVKYGKVKYF